MAEGGGCGVSVGSDIFVEVGDGLLMTVTATAWGVSWAVELQAAINRVTSRISVKWVMVRFMLYSLSGA